MEGLEELLISVRRPATYLGLESNRVIKNREGTTCHLVLAYPDLYSVGMSYLGFQILYHHVNRQPDLWAERVYAPDKDLEKELLTRGLPLCSLESRTPLRQFDLVGFTGQHELNLPDILRMLRLSGIPLRADERSVEDPLVIMGGPLAAQPEPIAPALDAVFLGDGEEGLIEIARTVGEGRRRGWSRERILDALQNIGGVYIPGRYRMIFGHRGEFLGCQPLAGAPEKIHRRVLADLDAIEPPTVPVVPLIRPVHDRLTVEIQRGCTRGCRFCQAGMINRPVRQRSAEKILEAVSCGLRNTGYDEISLLSLSAGDHPQIEAILESLINGSKEFPLSVSLPSLRAETLKGAIADCIRRTRKTGFTIAPEAGSERLRRFINKNLSEEEIFEAGLAAFRAGWRLIKLYFMIGLPSESEDDRLQIVSLVRSLRQELAKIAPPRINVGLSVFVPKAHTPFQWEAMLSLEEARQVQTRLRRELESIRGVKVGYSLVEMSWVEGVLARGDRRLFPALASLGNEGLLAWAENFDWQKVRQAFWPLLSEMPDPLRERSIHEPLCWDHLVLGPTKEFLIAEREKARQLIVTPDCSRSECYACGACVGEIRPRLVEGNLPLVLPPVEKKNAGAVMRLRLRLSKLSPASYLGHLDFIGALERAMRRAGWPLVYSEGFHPQPKISSGPACPLGVVSYAEWLDVDLSVRVELDKLKKALERHLPQGVTIEEMFEVEKRRWRLSRLIVGIRWSLELPQTEDAEVWQQKIQQLAAGANLHLVREGRTIIFDVPLEAPVKVSNLAAEVVKAGGKMKKEALLFREEGN